MRLEALDLPLGLVSEKHGIIFFLFAIPRFEKRAALPAELHD